MSLPRSHTQRPAVSLHLFPTQRSTPLCLHLHPPYFCHHIQTIKKILCCLWFPSFLIFFLLSVCALCSVSLSVQGPNKSTSLHNHLTSIIFALFRCWSEIKFMVQRNEPCWKKTEVMWMQLQFFKLIILLKWKDIIWLLKDSNSCGNSSCIWHDLFSMRLSWPA